MSAERERVAGTGNHGDVVPRISPPSGIEWL
jgi:hypothetical protein